MRVTTALCVALAATAFAAPAHAVFKCTTAKGIVYQDRPCREGNEADVRIVVPTGELAPKATARADDATPANAPRAEEQTRSVKSVRSFGDEPGKIATSGDRKTSDDGSSRQTKPASSAERTVPMTADQARNTDASAKYYATDGFGAGNETPTQMNCESPSGEKRVFYLSNGKLMSI